MSKHHGTTKGLQRPGRIAYLYICRNPGCCTAEIDRACRTARGGHRWMYFTVERLIIRRLVRTAPNGTRADLYPVCSDVATEIDRLVLELGCS
jgi:predicted transcriptional regulator